MRDPHLRALMGAWTAFNTGDAAYVVLVIVITFGQGGAVAVGAATVLSVLPGGVVGPMAATLAVSRRPQLHLALGNGARALTTIAMIVAVFSGAPVVVILALVALDSLVSAAVRPLHGALVVRLAGTASDAAAANAASSLLLSASTLAGPGLAGLALGLVGTGWAFALPTLLFVAGSGVALLISLRDNGFQLDALRSRPPKGAVRAQLNAVGAGFRAILASRPATAAATLFVVNVAVVGVWCVAGASVATDRLGLGEGGITTIMTFYGAGGLLGALATLSIVGRRRLGRVLVEGMVGVAVALAAVGFFVLPVAALASAAGLGAAVAAAYAVSPTLVQRSVAKAAMVPATASLQSLYLLGMAAGGILAPPLIDGVGVTVAVAVVSAVAAVITLAVWPLLRRADALTPDDADKLAILRATPSLAPLRALGLEHLARSAARLTVPAGSQVVRQGESGDRLYVIASGLADVFVDGRRTATLGPGGSFGEIALLHDVPRSATVTALDDLDLVAVDRADFLDAVSTDAGGVSRLGRVAQTRLDTPPFEDRLVEQDREAALRGRSVVELLASQRPLAFVAPAALNELAEAVRVVAASDGAVVTREGDHGSTYYVVLDGSAEKLRGDRAVGTLGPGEGFDDEAILRDVPHPVTVRAVGDSTLLAVDRESFRRALPDS